MVRMQKIFLIGVIVFLVVVGGCGSSTTSVVMPGFSGQYNGEFWFSPNGGSLYTNDDFELRWEGGSPPPSFTIKVENLDSPWSLVEPGLKVSVKYQNRDWHGYQQGWLCYPINWLDDTNYVVKVILPEGEVASAHFFFRESNW